MKERLCRLVVSAAAMAFSLSFFLPASSTRSAAAILRWTLDTAADLDTRLQAACFAAVAAVIAYSYAWSFLVALAALAGRKFTFLENRWLHFAFHASGGLILAVLGAVMLLSHDTWIPMQAQWAAAVVPFVVLAVMLCAILGMSARKGIWMIALMGFLPHAPLQLVLARAAADVDEPAWGFVMAATGAAIAVAGSLCLLLIRAPRQPATVSHGPLT